MNATRTFVLTPGPHLHVAQTTASVMWWVNGSLAPAVLWGAYVFGFGILLVVASSIAGAVAAEWLSCKSLRRRSTVRDGSAVCTGLLLALTLPPLMPWWMAALGAGFAIVFAKMIFGGLGYNLFNPAMTGRAFLMATFPLAMTAGWAAPRAWFAAPLDAMTTATPLAALKEQGLSEAIAVTATGQGSVLSSLALGFRPGSIGEVSVLFVALGAAFLIARGIIGLTIPLSVIAGTALATSFTGAPLLHVMGGGLWLGAFYIATDYVTSPNMRRGQIVFGFTIGIITALIRIYGGFPEGICYAILIANTLVPALNVWFRPKRSIVLGSPS